MFFQFNKLENSACGRVPVRTYRYKIEDTSRGAGDTVAGSCCAARQNCCYCSAAAATWYMRLPAMDVAEATAPLRLLVLASILNLVAVSGLENGLSRTPHRGWTTWNKFRCNVGDNVSVTPLGEALLPLNLSLIHI